MPDCPGLYQQLRPTFEQLPPHFQSSKHYHLGIHATHPPMKLLAALRAAAHSNGGGFKRVGGREGVHRGLKRGVAVKVGAWNTWVMSVIRT